MKIQRTGRFTTLVLITPEMKDPETRLQALFFQKGRQLQKATDDGRAYTVEVKIVTTITVDPWQAEIGEYVHRDCFPFAANRPPTETLQPTGNEERRVFEPTPYGYQRVK